MNFGTHVFNNRKRYHSEFMSKWDLYHGEFWWKAVLILKILLRYLPHLHHPLRWDQLHFPVTDTNVMYNHYRYITHFFGENNCVCVCVCVAGDCFFTILFLKNMFLRPTLKNDCLELPPGGFQTQVGGGIFFFKL